MTRINVVPVGASLLAKFGKTQAVPSVVKNALLPDHFPEATNPYKRVDIELRSRADEHGVLNLEVLERSDSALGKLAGLGADFCAEWNSLRTVEEDEVLLFVASDTNDGLRAAVLVAAKYGRPIQYIDSPLAPSAFRSAFEPGQIFVVRIPQLDLDPANGKKPDDNTWLGLGEVGGAIARNVNRSGEHWDAVFHLSGGYKALLPYFLVVAEGVQTVVRSDSHNPQVRVRAYVLHESSEAPVRLPIRWLQGNPLALARDLVTYAGAGVEIDAAKLADLRGIYLEDQDVSGRRKLTEAGMIMVRTLCALG
jgi:hypothetical protein